MAARRVLGITAGVIALVALQATAGSPTSGDMDGAVYASRIPLYPGAQLSGESASAWARTLFGPPEVRRRSWSFKVHAGSQRLVDYYTKRLPAAQREDLSGGVTFALVPDGAAAGETVRVTVRDGLVQVEEIALLR